MSNRTLRQKRVAHKQPTDLIESDIAIMEVLIVEDVGNPFEPKQEVAIATPDGRKAVVPSTWLRRRGAPHARRDCPHCHTKDGMVFDYFYQFWKCTECNWRMPI